MKQVLLLLLACAASGCSHAQPDLLTQLRALERSCSSDAQCRTVPLGAKPCGGPEAYLPYSSARTEPSKASALAERYGKERAAAHQKEGVAGDCMMVMDPGAVCHAGKCELGGPGKDK